jgi:pilus assembly protein CpaC
MTGRPLPWLACLQNNYSNDVRQTPWLGNVPILGSLFSSKRFQRNESELVIIVTPRLVQPAPHPDQLASPLDAFDEPSESELFLLGKTAGGAIAMNEGQTP